MSEAKLAPSFNAIENYVPFGDLKAVCAIIGKLKAIPTKETLAKILYNKPEMKKITQLFRDIAASLSEDVRDLLMGNWTEQYIVYLLNQCFNFGFGQHDNFDIEGFRGDFSVYFTGNHYDLLLRKTTLVEIGVPGASLDGADRITCL